MSTRPQLDQACEQARLLQKRGRNGHRYAWAVGGLMVGLNGCASGNLTSGTALVEPKWVSGEPNLSKEEQNWNCGRLHNAIEARVAKIVQLQNAAKTEATSAPPTFERMFQSWGASDAAAKSPSLNKIKPERDAAEIYNTALKSKGCPAVDVDKMVADLAAIVAPAAAPPKLLAPRPLGEVIPTTRTPREADPQ